MGRSHTESCILINYIPLNKQFIVSIVKTRQDKRGEGEELYPEKDGNESSRKTSHKLFIISSLDDNKAGQNEMQM